MPESVFRLLVPNAPLHRRTEGDIARSETWALRERLKNFSLPISPKRPTLRKPSLVSTYSGEIKSILLSLPKYSVSEPDLVPAYQSLIRAFKVGTQFIVVHHKSYESAIESWFSAAGHDGNVTYVALADYVNFTDWAEDAYLSLVDEADGTHYLMEPWEFKRAGDALIADAVEHTGALKATQAPLIFQGGNCLIGQDHWFLGRDYFADSVALLSGQRPPVAVPQGAQATNFARDLFRDYADARRQLVVLGTDSPIGLPQYVGARAGPDYILDIPAEGTGTYQPIFHIDMFVTLVGSVGDGRFRVLVGDPTVADKLLGTNSPYALADVYDNIAAQLESIGFEVFRNPIVHWPTRGDKTRKLSELRDVATSSNDNALARVVSELTALGAKESTEIVIRSWHHITWNNCLVEATEANPTVYLPTFGHGQKSVLADVDQHMVELWESMGFAVKRLGDFNGFAERQGVVHCIKKYLKRSDPKQDELLA